MTEKLNQLKDSLEKLVALDPQELVRTDYLGASFDFGEYVPLFELVLRLFRELHAADLSTLPDSQIEQLQDATNRIAGDFGKIKAFEPKDVSSPADQRDHLAQTLKGTHEAVFQTVSWAVAYASSRSVDLRRVQREAKALVAEIDVLKMDTVSQLQEFQQNATAIVNNIREAAGEVGVGQRASQFRDQAEQYATAKKTWLRASVGVAALAIALAAGNVGYLLSKLAETEISAGRAIELAVAKVLLFSVLYYALVWVVRTYRAASHNEVVNRHRENALRTFETFVAAATDEQTKQAVLLRATECVFGHQTSGFSEPGRDDSTSARLLEIVRGVRPGIEER
ncbi:MAG: hypothetical protein F4Y77_07390 [Holophagales bacterium]|nr:hypothetical protein [Holophagales bacterium]